MKVLVTGGAGYIGSHACKELSRAGYLPVSFDNLSNGHKKAVKWGPLIIGNITANLMEVFMSNPLITKDQLRLLKYDNIASGNYKTNFDYKIPANLKLEDEINKYSYMWRESGQFAKN